MKNKPKIQGQFFLESFRMLTYFLESCDQFDIQKVAIGNSGLFYM